MCADAPRGGRPGDLQSFPAVPIEDRRISAHLVHFVRAPDPRVLGRDQTTTSKIQSRRMIHDRSRVAAVTLFPSGSAGFWPCRGFGAVTAPRQACPGRGAGRLHLGGIGLHLGADGRFFSRVRPGLGELHPVTFLDEPWAGVGRLGLGALARAVQRQTRPFQQLHATVPVWARPRLRALGRVFRQNLRPIYAFSGTRVDQGGVLCGFQWKKMDKSGESGLRSRLRRWMLGAGGPYVARQLSYED